jgi:hypothetical protein
MRTAELGVVIMMVIVGTSPNAAGAQGEDSKNFHQRFGEAGVWQYRMMLLIVVNYKEPEHQKAGQKAANNPTNQMEIPECPGNRRSQKECSRENVKPTLRSGIHCVRLGRQNKIFSGFHGAP